MPSGRTWDVVPKWAVNFSGRMEEKFFVKETHEIKRGWGHVLNVLEVSVKETLVTKVFWAGYWEGMLNESYGWEGGR
jgi:hypothetical protein